MLILTQHAIDRPGFYRMPDSIYHADPCPTPSMGSTQAKTLVDETPAHARLTSRRTNPDFEEKDLTPAMDLGSAAHALAAGQNHLVEVFDYKDWRTDAAKKDKADARARFVTPLLPGQFKVAETMADIARPVFRDLTKSRKGAEAHFELAMACQAVGGGWRRGKLDSAASDFSVLIDYKTTGESIAPEEFARPFYNKGAAIQESLYRGIVDALVGFDRNRKFYFVSQENFPPYAVRVNECDDLAREVGRMQVGIAGAQWDRAVSTGEWPAYDLKPAVAEFPNWMHAKWSAKEFALAMVEADAYGRERARLENREALFGDQSTIDIEE